MLESLGNWGADTLSRYDESGLGNAALHAGRGVFTAGWLAATSRRPVGTNVFQREWDVLVVLDACRLDAFRRVATEYDWLGPVGSLWSVGSSTHEWTANTFTRRYADEIRHTGLVSANSFAGKVFEERAHPPLYYPVPFDLTRWDTVRRETFGYTEWCFEQHHEYDDLFEAVPADHVTERAVVAGRTQDVDRLVVHYLQPHRPFLSQVVETGTLSDVDDDPYEACRQGTLSDAELHARYLDNLRYVLDSVETLLRNIDADRVAVTADHGELLGELGLYEHPEAIPHPKLRRVPWAVADASDEGTLDPPETPEYREEFDPADQLADLGYL